MVPLATIQDTVDLAKAYYIQLLDADTALLVKAKEPVNACKVVDIKRHVRALTWDINGQYNDSTTQQLYTCLQKLISPYNGIALPVDPNVIIPGTSVITVNVSVTENNDLIPLTSTNDNPAITINWQTDIVPGYTQTFAQRYGNNPQLALYSNQGVLLVGDEQTPPQRTYTTSGNPTSPLLTVVYDYPIGTSVYVQITGVQPVTGGSSSTGGGIAPPLTFTQANLLADNSDPDNVLYYLPFGTFSPKQPFLITVNDVTLAGWVYNTADYTPGRLYGFANNSTQTIKIYVL